MTPVKNSTEQEPKDQQTDQTKETDGRERILIPTTPRWIQALKNPSAAYKQWLEGKTQNLKKK